MLKISAILYFLIVSIQCLNLCGDWIPYKDQKCFKVFTKKAIQADALEKCVELENDSTLLTIYDVEEQQFIDELMVEFNNISMNAWIGMEFNGHEYDWLDGTDSNFTNWSEDSIRDGSEVCVRLSLLNRTLGKWTDSSCKRQALIVCQRKPILSLNSMKFIIEDMIKTNVRQEFEIKSLNAVIDNIVVNQRHINDEQNERIDSLIPLGFLYTQLPEQSSPQQLWENMDWTEVTQQYSGLFFRAEGSGSQPFGQIQQANQSWISDMSTGGYKPKEFTKFLFDWTVYRHPENRMGRWNKLYMNQALFDRIELFTTNGEVRPKNTAIRIWKRIK